MLGIDPQLAVAGRRRGDQRGQIESDRQHEAQVIVGVFADQVDAPGRAEHAQPVGTAEAARKSGFHSCLHDCLRVLNAGNSRNPPRKTIRQTRIPAYAFPRCPVARASRLAESAFEPTL